jgi:glycosyltransferase involved in cell wall biosynthesis
MPAHATVPMVQNRTKNYAGNRNNSMKQLKIAVFHSFLKNKGGAEKVVLDICTHYNADLFVGSVRSDMFNAQSSDSFSQTIFHRIKSFVALHEDAKIPVWRHIKRQLYFIFSPQVNLLKDYDIVIISGNVFWAPNRIKWGNARTKVITYCHTPPRPFTDQQKRVQASLFFALRPFYSLFALFIRSIYTYSLKASDDLVANSKNIQQRIKTYLGLDSHDIYPPVDTDRFQFIKHGDYYLSHSRLEEMKRIPLIIKAFQQRPELQLVVCSSGPLKDWLENEIKQSKSTNIEYKGLVSDEELADLVGSCKAGIIIPIEEDAGISQCEIMAAGKPVLGVAEGGLLETVIHQETGYLIPRDPTVEDLIAGLDWMESYDLSKMRERSEQQASLFGKAVFFDKLDKTMSNLIDSE